MANNRVNVDLDMSVEGYVQGMDKATDSTKAYETETRKTKDSMVNLNKEFRKAKKDAQDLTAGYAQLSDAEKNSTLGREIASQLEQAKQKAAEFLDMKQDLDQELRSRASDTATWDAMKEGLGVGKDVMTALVSLTADLTGNEKELGKMIQKIAQVQSIANTAISVGNALQKQSALMNGVRRIQELALSKAIQLETSSTVGATVAQKAFNVVAKANPYVLLGTAALALVSALGAYMIAVSKAKDATDELKQEIHATSLQGQKDAQSEVTKLDLLYKATQNQALSIDERRKATEKLQEQYPGYFGNIKTETILAGEASKAYQQLKNDIIAVAMARAYQDKITEKAKENVDIEDEIKKQQKKLDKLKSDRDKNQGGGVPGAVSGAAIAGEAWNIQSEQNALDELKQKRQENIDAMKGYQKEIDKTSDAQKRQSNENNVVAGSIDDINNKLSNLKKRYSGGLIDKESYNKQRKELEEQLKKLQTGTDLAKGGKGGKTEVKAVSDSIDDLEKKISDLQDKAKKGILPEDLKDPDKYKTRLKELQSQLKELKIEWGFEEPETKLQKLQKALETSQKAYIIAVEVDDKDAQDAALNTYRSIEKELAEHKAKINIEPAIDPKESKKQLKEISDLIKDTYKANVDFKFDFSSLPEATKKEAEAILDQFNRIIDAKEKLNNIIRNDDNKYSQEAIDEAREKVVLLTGSYNELITVLNEYINENTAFKKMSDDINLAGEALQNLGSIMSSISNISGNKIFNAAAVLSQAVATYILGWTEATTKAAKLGPVGWAAFGLSSAAQMFAVVSQIKSAGKFAQGGTVGGSSYYGDKLMAFVNSGETILTRDQTKNVVNAIDNNKLDKQIIVIGETRLRGSDLYISYKNFEKSHNISTNKYSIYQ